MSSQSALEQRKAALSDEQRAALNHRLEGAARTPRGISRRPGHAPAVCSFGQQRVWLLNQLNPHAAITNRPTFLRLDGPLDVDVLNRCLHEIVRRHETLRTHLPLSNGEPVPHVAEEFELPLPVVDLTNLDGEALDREVQTRAREFARRPLDLSRGPLIETRLLKRSEQSHLLMVNVDHIVFDGWSANLFSSELAALYLAFSQSRPSPLPDLPIAYSDYACWQREQLEPAIRGQQLSYWLSQLGGAPTQIDLPTDRPRPETSNHRGARVNLLLPKSLADALRDLGRRENATLFMTLLAGFHLLLHRFTGQNDILVGSLVAGRTRLETEKLIGMFVNTLALRSRLANDARFIDLLRQTRRTALEAFENQDLPFERLIHALPVGRDRAPLVQVLFQFRNLPPATTDAGPISIEVCDFDVGIPQLELALEVTETANGLDCLLRYDADLFESATAMRLLEEYRELLAAVAEAPEQALSTLSFGTNAEDGTAQFESGKKPVPEKGEWPLTAPQTGVWLDQQLSANPGRYNFGESWRIQGALHLPHLQRAIQHVVNTTEALRLRVFERRETPVQRLSGNVGVDLQVVDFRSSSSPEDDARQWMDHEMARAFEADAECLFSYTALQIADHDWFLCCKYHHIIMDGIGAAIVRRNVAEAYEAIMQGKTPAPCRGLGWNEVVADDLAYSQSPERQFAREYWKSHCHDLGNCPTLSTRGNTSIDGGPVRRLSTVLPNTLMQSLRHLGTEASPDCPLNHVFFALLYAYVARLTGSEDINIALPRANRRSEELRQTAGMLTNVVLGRVRFPAGGSLRELLQQVSNVLRETAEHERFPLTDLQQLLPVEQRSSRLFTAVFNYLPISGRFRFADALAEVEMVSPGPCKELTVLVRSGRPDDVSVMRLVYPAALYTAEEIGLHRDRLLHLFESAPGHLDTALSELPVLPPAEKNRLLVEWNAANATDAGDCCVHQLIEKQCERTPEAVAVAFKDKHLTYRDLDRRANQLAHQLRGLGVRRGTLVAISMPRSLEMTVGLLAIFKAGAAYLPLDLQYPQERLDFMLNDARPPVLLVQRELPRGLSAFKGEVVYLDDTWTSLEGNDKSCVDEAATPDDLAYVMYTSGSTGVPKGVMVTHRGLANHNRAVAGAYGLNRGDRVMQGSSLSFDISVEEMFPSWVSGATVILRPEQNTEIGNRFLDWIEHNEISVLNLPTALWHAWVGELERSNKTLPQCLRLVVVGGEAASSKAYASWLRVGGRNVRWINSYGPTETTVVATLYEPDPHAQHDGVEEIPIGKPIDNMRAYILDSRGRLAPIGVVGELYLAGAGLARGYLNRPELTAEKFIADPFSNDPGARLYKTGDLARRRPDGNIDFVGRIDDQVKLRGFRVELGEVESALLRHEAVAECAVVLREDRAGDRRLVAYWVPRLGVNATGLREFLANRLPHFMVPSAFVSLSALPLTPNGKLDRSALPEADASISIHRDDFVSPQNDIEAALVEIWAEVLGVERIGVHDNFFELGGHSLLAIRMIAEMEKILHCHVPLAVLFKSPTIAALGRDIAAQSSEQPGLVAIPLQTEGTKPPLVFMPPLGGNGLHWKAVMAHWGSDRPVFALGSSGKGLPWPADAGLAEIAKCCIAAVDDMVSKSPIHLAGYSFGGKLAYEMARQLEQSGRRVGTVVVIDTGPAPVLAKRPRLGLKGLLSFFRNLPFFVLDDLLKAKRTRLASELRRKSRSWKQRLLRGKRGQRAKTALEDVIDTHGLPSDYVERMRVGFAAAESYVAGPYSGRVLLVRARTRPLFRPHATDLGWSRYVTGRLEIMVIPGNHLSILEEPNSRQLAERLQAALAADE